MLRLVDARRAGASAFSTIFRTESTFTSSRRSSTCSFAAMDATGPPRADGREHARSSWRSWAPRPSSPTPTDAPVGVAQHRALLVEEHAGLLHLHRVRSLLGQLPGAPAPASSCRPSTSPSTCATTSTSTRGDMLSRPRASSARRPPSSPPRAPKTPRAPRPPEAPPAEVIGINSYSVALVPNVIRPGRSVGVHHLPRVRRAVPRHDLVRRQDRRHAPQPRASSSGEFPHELQKTFQALETNGNPWNLTRMDRADVERRPRRPRSCATSPTRSFCTGSAARPATTTAPRRSPAPRRSLLKHAGVDFAILGSEETCTGDPARRAGNEFLYHDARRSRTSRRSTTYGRSRRSSPPAPTASTPCSNEYPDFGGHYEVVHHSDFLAGPARREASSSPTKAVRRARSPTTTRCYLGRYNERVRAAPRERAASASPASSSSRPKANRDKGLCCGAGGAQMWMEEQHSTQRVNKRSARCSSWTPAPTPLPRGCPFCQTMLTDGLKEIDDDLKHPVQQLDIAELLERSVIFDTAEKPVPAVESDAPRRARRHGLSAARARLAVLRYTPHHRR
ncbi:MAG: (Fe-S)-binding protein [Tetrasphaera sp.]